jgi:uncharacterized protein DUF4202
VSDDRFDRAVAAIDAANAESPTGREPDDAVRVTEWVRRLDPDASEALLLAARAHHIRRWTVPRSSYPDGRSGYLKWRRDLHEVHAAEVGRILDDAGYEAATIERVQEIVRKRRLSTDPEVQVLEDALCLTFIQTQYDDLAGRLDGEKMDGVVKKTLAKMSPGAQALAAQLLQD